MCLSILPISQCHLKFLHFINTLKWPSEHFQNDIIVLSMQFPYNIFLCISSCRRRKWQSFLPPFLERWTELASSLTSMMATTSGTSLGLQESSLPSSASSPSMKTSRGRRETRSGCSESLCILWDLHTFIFFNTLFANGIYFKILVMSFDILKLYKCL